MKIGALGQELAQQSVGVLVRPALPRALWIAEIDPQPGCDLQPGVLGQLGALVPGQRSAEMLGQGRDLLSAIASRTASAPCPDTGGPFFTRG